MRELAILLTLFLLVAPVLAEGAEVNVHKGKAGVYARLGLNVQKDPGARKVMLANPNFDCAMVAAQWGGIEPQEGKFDFSQLKQDVADWSANGKHVVIHVQLYGQALDDRLTPAWLWSKKDVRTISFSGGGMARGETVKIPAVWDDEFEKYVKPLVTKLASQFDGDPRVWYIQPGFGHLGNLPAQPSRFGGPALKSAGWTDQKWQAYCLRTAAFYRSCFKKTPLFVASPPLFIHDRQNNDYSRSALSLCKQLAVQGIALQLYGLHQDKAKMKDLYDSTIPLMAPALNGQTRFGFGDDWPIWVPESRRTVAPTIGFDDNFFKACLANCFSTADGIQLPTTMVYLNPPEIFATSPLSPQGLRRKDAQCYYRKNLAAMLEATRQQLLKNDAECFGK